MAYGLLKGKKGIIFGALDDRSIAWKVAEHCHAEGAEFLLTNAPVALRMGTINALAEKVGAEVVPADVTVQEDLENLIKVAMEKYGKVDFILHSVGMSPNVRKGRSYDDLNYEFFHKTLDISAMSLHRLLQACMKADAISEWGSVVALTYIAAQRTYPGYGDMADAKALLESIARGFGYHYGYAKKVRVNTVSQSPTVTTAGSGVAGFDDFIGNADRRSPLGNASAHECADYCVTLFSDLTRKVTMQNLFHDGGYSSVGEAPQQV
jgi:enoyl-[acyl-carrier protein] reductase I